MDKASRKVVTVRYLSDVIRMPSMGGTDAENDAFLAAAGDWLSG